MGCLRTFLMILLIVITVGAMFATFTKAGAEEFTDPKGINLRQESVRTGRGGFFAVYSRSHYGGGLRGGK